MLVIFIVASLAVSENWPLWNTDVAHIRNRITLQSLCTNMTPEYYNLARWDLVRSFSDISLLTRWCFIKSDSCALFWLHLVMIIRVWCWASVWYGFRLFCNELLFTFNELPPLLFQVFYCSFTHYFNFFVGKTHKTPYKKCYISKRIVIS